MTTLRTCVFEEKRYDAGETLGYLKVSVDYALRHPTLGEEVRAHLEARIGGEEQHGQTLRHPRRA
ncbi:MAG TPA: hypothetical protein VF713_26405 [Thermoanaerobaculia bacterium]